MADQLPIVLDILCALVPGAPFHLLALPFWVQILRCEDKFMLMRNSTVQYFHRQMAGYVY